MGSEEGPGSGQGIEEDPVHLGVDPFGQPGIGVVGRHGGEAEG
jgi:hypothetical protein